MKQTIIILLVIFFSGCKSNKETEIETSLEDNTFSQFITIIDQYANETLKNGNANSFALAVYKNGEMYQNYYGALDKELNNKPNDSSLYEIASITKTFTGALVAKAVLKGKINLEDDIRKYLEGDYSNLEYDGHPITVKHLLTHSMGLKNKLTKGFEAIRNKVTSGTFNYKTDFYTIDDLLKELKTVEVEKKPGTEFAYNSVGPELLAYILEKVNNKPFKDQMNEFLKELGMNHTYLDESQKHIEQLVKGYKGEKEAPVDYDPVYGAAGGAISTLPDLAIYMQYLVDNKNEAWVKEVSRTLFIDSEDNEQIGYLWQNIGIGEEEGYFYSKTGTSNGAQSGILICPDSNYGIVLLVNNTSEEAYNDWGTLFFGHIEPDLIKYPKLNLYSSLKSKFETNLDAAFKEYRTLKKDTSKFFINTNGLNYYGYQLLNKGDKQKAVEVFKFITEEFPKNANAFDSLGEAYFVIEDYDNALLNYRKSLELNPDSENAKNYIEKIEKLILEQS